MLRQAHDPERMNGGPGDWQRGKGFERVSLVSLRVRLWRIESWGEGDRKSTRLNSSHL